MVSYAVLVLIYTPTTCMLSEFSFVTGGFVRADFMSTVNIPTVVIILPLFDVVSNVKVLGGITTKEAMLVVLCMKVGMPCAAVFLLAFFDGVSEACRRTTTVSKYPPVHAF